MSIELHPWSKVKGMVTGLHKTSVTNSQDRAILVFRWIQTESFLPKF